MWLRGEERTGLDLRLDPVRHESEFLCPLTEDPENDTQSGGTSLKEIWEYPLPPCFFRVFFMTSRVREKHWSLYATANDETQRDTNFARTTTLQRKNRRRCTKPFGIMNVLAALQCNFSAWMLSSHWSWYQGPHISTTAWGNYWLLIGSKTVAEP